MSKWSVRVSIDGLIIRRPNGSVYGGVYTASPYQSLPEAMKLCALAIKRAAVDAEIARVTNG